MRARFSKLLTGLIMTLSLASRYSNAEVGNFLPFKADTFAAIKEEFAGKPFMVSLWSVDCAPCRIELDMLGELKASQPDFPLVIISTDQIEEREESLYVLEDYGLENLATWMFADSFVERLRYSIDPAWYGELPRSYFYDADHQAEAHSGVLTQEMLDTFAASVAQ